VLASNFASQTANTFLAAPNGTAGVPTFRAIVGADIPTLNQNTTGTAANVTGIVALANGGTGTATPGLVAGTNVTITGSWPNQTINSSGGGGGGGVSGSGTVNYVSKWNSTTSLANSAIFDNGTNVLIGTTDVGTPTYGISPQFVTASATGGVIDIRSTSTNIVINSSLGRIQFSGKDDQSVAYTSAVIEAIANGTAGTGNSGGGVLKFMTSTATTGATPSARMFISPSNVTIGSTNSNISQLVIFGGVYATSSIQAPTVTAYGAGYGCAIAGNTYIVSANDAGLFGTDNDEIIAMLDYDTYEYHYAGGVLKVGSGAYVGINAATDYPLHVGSQVSNISIYADYDIVAYSDISVKENIRPIENVIERVQQSRGVLYDRIDSESKDNIGFIAQELEVAFPELVVTNEDGTKAVKYQNAVAVLFEAIKEQQKQIDEIKKILNAKLFTK